MISRTCGVNASTAESSRIRGRSPANSSSDRNTSSASNTSGRESSVLADGAICTAWRATVPARRSGTPRDAPQFKNRPVLTPMNSPAGEGRGYPASRQARHGASAARTGRLTREGNHAGRVPEMLEPARDLLLLRAKTIWCEDRRRHLQSHLRSARP